MKIAVIGSNGKAGKMIIEEAVTRGIDVTAIARKDNDSKAQKFLQKDMFDLVTDDVKGFDVIVDAFGTFDADKLDQHVTSLNHLSDIVSGTNIRLLVVGGAGSLYLDKNHTIQLKDSPDFPDMFKPLANSMGTALEHLRKREDVEWTYISPAADFQAEAPRLGEYILAGEEFSVNDKGESMISYADYAIALVDEIISGNNIKKRISVLQK